ncbi:unnamed protein product [Hymenolepis diminuta]|uniref:Uncharacterized protein n=1 Tax=Hymenolepis diminuta TaxID=6216 RepID=A0A564Y2G8_HYMDI|nr:unnamed protein product [Hymenolepis diminuta]
MSICNCSELIFFGHPTLGSSFSLKSSFLKREGENHLLQVSLSTTSFPQVSLSVFAAELALFPL